MNRGSPVFQGFWSRGLCMDYVGVPEDRGPTMDAKSSSMRERERVSK